MIMALLRHTEPDRHHVKEQLSAMAELTGWRFHTHHTGDSAASALLWLHTALEGRR